jgi:hypothetical protein
MEVSGALQRVEEYVSFPFFVLLKDRSLCSAGYALQLMLCIGICLHFFCLIP